MSFKYNCKKKGLGGVKNGNRSLNDDVFFNTDKTEWFLKKNVWMLFLQIKFQKIKLEKKT